MCFSQTAIVLASSICLGNACWTLSKSTGTLMILPFNPYCALLYPSCQISAKEIWHETSLVSNVVNPWTELIYVLHCMLYGDAKEGNLPSVTESIHHLQIAWPNEIIFMLLEIDINDNACTNASLTLYRSLWKDKISQRVHDCVGTSWRLCRYSLMDLSTTLFVVLACVALAR